MFTRSLRLMLVLLGIALLSACTQVDTGNVGVGRSFGKIDDKPYPQGIYVTVFDSVDEFTTKEVSFQLDNLSPKSKDNLTLKDLDIDVYYRVDPARIPSLYVKYQGDYVRHGTIVDSSNTPEVLVMGYNRVLRAAREATYTATATYPATTMHTQRAELGEAIRKALQAELDASDKGAFFVTTVNVRALTTDPAIEKAIQAQIATDQEVVRVQKQKQIAIAEADRKRELAKGEADANNILNASLTGPILQIRLAEIQRDTIVASSGKGSTVINGVNATPLIQAK